MTSAQYRKRLEEILEVFIPAYERQEVYNHDHNLYQALQAILSLNEEAIGEDEQTSLRELSRDVIYEEAEAQQEENLARNTLRRKLRTIIGKGK